MRENEIVGSFRLQFYDMYGEAKQRSNTVNLGKREEGDEENQQEVALS